RARPALDCVSTTVYANFSFCWAANHPDLHSFPTRRSSDLGSRSLAAHDTPHTSAKRITFNTSSSDCVSLTIKLRIAFGACVFFRDRKSTRLNSSHLGSSYAVFCLKKKNGPARCTDHTQATG